MIWTLVVFVISLFILVKAVFPRIGQRSIRGRT